MKNGWETYLVEDEVYSFEDVAICSFSKLFYDLKSFVALFPVLDRIPDKLTIVIEQILAVRSAILVKFGHLLLAIFLVVLMKIHLS